MSTRSRTASLAVMTALLLAGTAAADSAPSVAAPGECAHSDRELETSPSGAAAGGGSGSGSRSVGGSPGDFFDPGDGSGDGTLPGVELPGTGGGASSQSASTGGPMSLGGPSLPGLSDAALPPVDPPIDPGEILPDLLEAP